MSAMPEEGTMIYTLTGTNSYLLTSASQKFIMDFITKSGDFGLEKLNADEISFARILESVQAMPFLSDSRLVVIYSPSGNKELNEKIDKVLELVNDQTDVLFVEPKFDKRSSLYKTLKKRTEFKEFADLDERQLAEWLASEARNQEGQLTATDARYLVQRIGINQLRLSNELAKLLSFSPQITKQNIDLLTQQTPTATTFDLLDAALSGNSKKAMMLYSEQRKQKVEPMAILALLAWQLHVIALVKTADNRSPDAIAKEAKLNPYVVRKSMGIAKNLSATQIKKLVASTLALDIRLKSESIGADEALQNLILLMGN